MSNVLAAAAVTSTLRYVLARAVQDLRPGAVGGANVTTVRPADLSSGDLAEAAGINLWCYLATPNHAATPDDLPARQRNGALAARPVAALDLHYLVTCYGNDATLEPQRLLARAALALRTTSVLTRDVVRTAIAHYAAQPDLEYLADSDLADDVELVKLAPTPLSLEEMSKLWGVLDCPYRLSLTYVATAVLVTSALVPAAAPPVATRSIDVAPWTPPRLATVTVDGGAPGVPATTGSVLVLRGSALLPRAGTATVLVAGAAAPPLAGATPGELRVPLGDEVPAGAHLVSVRHTSAPGPDGAPARLLTASNALPVTVRPSVTSVTPAATTVELAVSPPVRSGQDVRLLLTRLVPAGPDAPAGLTVAIPPRSTTQPPLAVLSVPRAGLADGSWLVRLQVDGVQSSPGTVDGVYAEPRLDLP